MTPEPTARDWRIARRREQTLKEFCAVRDAAPRGCRGDAIDVWLKGRFRLNGRKRLGKSTIYRWERRYKAAGLQGLVDLRSTTQRSIRSKDDQAGPDLAARLAKLAMPWLLEGCRQIAHTLESELDKRKREGRR